jgi:predicted outer membrane repeat protein
MKSKYYAIFIFLLLLVCCAGAAYATSDDNAMELDQSSDIVSAEDNEELSVSEEDCLSDSPDETILKQTDNTVLSDGESTSSMSPLEKFTNDLESGAKVVNLTGDIKIKTPFKIKRDVVIDGQGHTIDAQKKTFIFKISGPTVTLKNLVLKNGKSEKGGTIFAINCKVNLNNCKFTSNEGTLNGGAIYLSNGQLKVNKCTFTNNVAHLRGGAIIAYSARVVISDSRFENNKIVNSKKMGYGGAVWVNKGSSSITNTVFKKNSCISKALKSHSKATKYQFSGGAIYYSLGSSHTLTGCTFDDNVASNAAGAVYGLKCGSLKIEKCTFNRNKASFEDGGAICYNGKTLVIKNSKFNKNHAYEDGGVMDSFSVTKNKVKVTITGCEFKDNTAYKGGGAMWLGVKTYYTMKNNKFINNKAGLGGVFYSEACTAKINNCLFQGNQAKKVASWTMKTKAGAVLKHVGGAIMLEKKSMKITKCVFKKNKASVGGAIFHLGGKLKLSKTKFVGNKAKVSKNVHKK